MVKEMSLGRTAFGISEIFQLSNHSHESIEMTENHSDKLRKGIPHKLIRSEFDFAFHKITNVFLLDIGKHKCTPNIDFWRVVLKLIVAEKKQFEVVSLDLFQEMGNDQELLRSGENFVFSCLSDPFLFHQGTFIKCLKMDPPSIKL